MGWFEGWLGWPWVEIWPAGLGLPYAKWCREHCSMFNLSHCPAMDPHLLQTTC